MAKLLINCKFCGTLLLKTTQPLVAVLQSEIKCPHCHRVVHIPEEIIVVPEKDSQKNDSVEIEKSG